MGTLPQAIPPCLRWTRTRAEWGIRAAPLRAKGLEHAGRARLFGASVAFDSFRTFRHLVSEVFQHRTYDVGFLPASPTIVDCGANIGVSSWYFNWRYPGCSTICIEPSPTSFRLLTENIATNGWTCTAYNEASSAKDGTIELFLKEGQPTTPSASTTRGRLSGPAVIVATHRLSSRMPEHVDLLKVDIEGAEVDVLPELEESGALSQVDRLAIEYHHQIPGRLDELPDFLERLTRNGYAYTLDSRGDRSNPHSYQDMMIYASRR